MSEMTSVVSIALVMALTAGGAVAATSVEKAVALRQSGYKETGKSFKAINDELKKDAPRTKLIAAEAKKVHGFSLAIPKWFPKGSGPESGLKTRAKSDIWAEPAKFAEATKAFQVESQKLRVAARKGDVEAIKLQVKATGGSCGGCHKPFRAEEK
ncbi:cytochrome c [Phenylobacterium sp. LH3H17]|uniref:c-type cytochrome n=1 Tax=Phenylobacterium sp. LH3H17 TaxID=2903901 RepID=UPI0020C9594B|nr:cytochrome c [Phenylobacterium sp. LH3H17]UTP41033.1 cytochrome c [Phenylobacterium sp. LH3H17]